MPCFVHFFGFGSAKSIEISKIWQSCSHVYTATFYEPLQKCSFWFLQVRCAHKSGDVINFTIVACRISSRLKPYKNCKNRLRLAKVVVKNKMSRFLWFTVYMDVCQYKQGRVTQNERYSRSAFSTRKAVTELCYARPTNRWPESPDLRRVGSPGDTAPWSRRRSCLPASWVVWSDGSVRSRRVVCQIRAWNDDLIIIIILFICLLYTSPSPRD